MYFWICNLLAFWGSNTNNWSHCQAMQLVVRRLWSPRYNDKSLRQPCDQNSAIFIRLRKGDSANAVPRYQKLRVRVIHIWDYRKGQHYRSAMVSLTSGEPPSWSRLTPTPGKYAYLGKSSTKLWEFLRASVRGYFHLWLQSLDEWATSHQSMC